MSPLQESLPHNSPKETSPRPPDLTHRKKTRIDETEAQRTARHQARHERHREERSDRITYNESGTERNHEEKQGMFSKSRKSIGRGIMALGQRVIGNGNVGGNRVAEGSGKVKVGDNGDEEDKREVFGEKGKEEVGEEYRRRRRRRRRSTIGENSEERGRNSEVRKVRFDVESHDVSQAMRQNERVTPKSPSPTAKYLEIEERSIIEAKQQHITKRVQEESESVEPENKTQVSRLQVSEVEKAKKEEEERDSAAREKQTREKEEETQRRIESIRKAKSELDAREKKEQESTQRLQKQQEEKAHQERLAKDAAKHQEQEKVTQERKRQEAQRQVNINRIERQKEEQARLARLARQEEANHKDVAARLEVAKNWKQEREQEHLEQENLRKIDAQKHRETQRKALEQANQDKQRQDKVAAEKAKQETARQKVESECIAREKQRQIDAQQHLENQRKALELQKQDQKRRFEEAKVKADTEKAARKKSFEEKGAAAGKREQGRLRKEDDAARIRVNLPACNTPAAMALQKQQQRLKQDAFLRGKAVPAVPAVQQQQQQPHNKVQQRAAQPDLRNTPVIAKLTHKNLNAFLPKGCIGNMERTILEGIVPMSAEEIRAEEIERGERREKRCIGNMERTILEGYVPMSEEDRKRNGERG